MSCHLCGADELRTGLKQRFQGMSESDVAVREVSCLGQCDGAPAVSINDHIYRGVTPAQAEALVLTALGGSGLPAHAGRKAKFAGWRPILTGMASRMARCGRRWRLRDWDGVIAKLKASGLSGLGGAGFPTGVKWEAVRKAPGRCEIRRVQCR